MKRLSSVSVFFPCYNDGGTIASMVVAAKRALEAVTDDYEIIVVNDGSKDYSSQVLEELSCRYDFLRVITHPRNLGYGAALRSGFAAATKEFIFYTDGDAQYNPLDLPRLVEALREGIDLVNGYKANRGDPFYRKLLGQLYNRAVRALFGLRVRDVNCDFRLMRASIFDRVKLEFNSGAICVELVKKAQEAGFGIAEVPIPHYPRPYGRSQFWRLWRILGLFRELAKLWWHLRVRKAELMGAREGAMAEPPRRRQTS